MLGLFTSPIRFVVSESTAGFSLAQDDNVNFRGGWDRDMHEVVVYSRARCCLCDVVKETLAALEGKADFQWREVDIDAAPELRRMYNDEVPVVMIDGRKAFKYRMTGREFLRALKGR